MINPMTLPRDVSELLEMVNSNSYVVSMYNRGKLNEIIDQNEPYFVQHGGIMKKAIINYDDFCKIMEIIILLNHINELGSCEEMKFYELVSKRLDSPVVANFSDVAKHYNVSKEEIEKAMDEVEFE